MPKTYECKGYWKDDTKGLEKLRVCCKKCKVTTTIEPSICLHYAQTIKSPTMPYRTYCSANWKEIK